MQSKIIVVNQNRMIEKAFQCFLKDGVASTTLDVLAWECSIPYSALKQQFPDKDNLILHLIQTYHQKFSADLWLEDMEWSTRDGAWLLRNYLRWVNDLFLDLPHAFVLFGELNTYLFHRYSHEGRIKFLSRLPYENTSLRKIFVQGKEDGSIIMRRDAIQEADEFRDVVFGFLCHLPLQCTDGCAMRSRMDAFVDGLLNQYLK